ncbi:MAG: restriction endonuclease subunit S [Caulobacteraceae bacterium]
MSREGYKMTELGEIPQEWNICRVFDIRDKSDKYSFTGGPFGSNLKSCDYTEDGIRVIQLQNIGDGYFSDQYKIYTSQRKADELISCNIYPGEIILAKMADPVARACIIPNDENRYLMCSDGIRLKVDNNECDSRYIMYSINSEYFRKNAIANSTGSTRLRIGLNELKNLPLIIPPLSEQQKIADILSSVDQQIEQTDVLIEKTKELKKGLMQRLLTKGIGHTEFRDTEVGRIPKGWEVKKLLEIGDIVTGNTPKTSDKGNYGSEYLFVSPADLGSKKYIEKTSKMLSKSGFEKTRRLPKGSILVTCIGSTIGKIGIASKELCTNQQINSIVCREQYSNEYIYYAIDFNFWRYESFISTQAVPIINKTVFSGFEIAIPPLDEQIKIASILSEIDEKIDAYVKKRGKFDILKSGLMQKLLTGKIRVLINV